MTVARDDFLQALLERVCQRNRTPRNGESCLVNHFVTHIFLSGGWKSVRGSFCRPYGTCSKFPLYPGLTPWAKILPPLCGYLLAPYALLRLPESSSHAQTRS